MDELGCTAKRLSELSGISMTQISRYRNGICVPYSESDAVSLLSKGIVYMAKEKGITVITEEYVAYSLSSSAYSSEYDFNYDILSQNMDTLISTLGINTTHLSLYCNLNASTISRIRYGKQKPRDPFWVVQSVAQYTATNYFSLSDQRRVLELLGRPEAVFESIPEYARAIHKWLSGESGEEVGYGSAALSMLDSMDTFDLNEFMRTRSIGKVRIPTLPFHIPSTKTYTGIKGMEDGILAFLKTTALSVPSRDAVIYSDHPMDHCVQESDFPENWMKGVGAVLLKGVHIHMIHNIDRPLSEMMLGLEAWMPVYMTGMVTPYYFDNTRNNTHHHLIMVSGSAAFVGDAVAGYPESGRYVFYKANHEVAHCRARADQLLSRAKPLMEIYRDDRADEFNRLIDSAFSAFGTLKNHLTAPPMYTIGDDLLARILARNNIGEKDARIIRSYSDQAKKRTERFLNQGKIIENVALWSEKEFNDYPTALSLSDTFGNADIFYTYQEYREHVLATERFAAEHKNYELRFNRTPYFRNIRIVICENSYILVSKSKAPAIHFVIHHPKMVNAMSDLLNVRQNNKNQAGRSL